MNRLIIFRFGSSNPVPGDLAAMTVITNGDLGNAMGLPFPGGLINLVETDFSPSEIAEIYQVTAAEVEDNLPIMVFKADHTCGVYLLPADVIQSAVDRFIAGGLDALRSEADAEPEQEPEQVHSVVNETCELSLDELLDLLNEVGSFEALTPVQKKRLEELTK